MYHMSVKGRSFLLGAVVIWLCSITIPAYAQQPPLSGAGMTKAGRFTQGYDWHEGERRKTVWLNPDLVAEFHTGAVQTGPVTALYPGAVVLEQHGSNIRIWRLPVGIDTLSVLDMLNSRADQGVKYSPVFHDAPGPASRMRALPGNIIVYFNPGWDRNNINQWVAAQNLGIVHQLANDPAAYVLKTGPGLEALDLANTLHETGEVNAAIPDWWHETVTR